MITSKVDLCNLGVSHLGNYASVNNIDTPTTDIEITCAKWYDVSRQTFLKMTMPNFALKRRKVALVVGEVVPFGFEKVYEYPNDCLKLLGIGDIECKRNNFTVEGNRIYTNEHYEDGLPIRFISDFTDVTRMSPEFQVGFSWFFASFVCMDITQDLNKKKLIETLLPEKMSAMSALNAQENVPIRISRSLFKQARYNWAPRNSTKR